VKRGEIWWADLGPHRPGEQTGRRPVVIWQSDAITRALQSVLVVPLTTNLSREGLVGTTAIEASLDGLHERSLALAFQMRSVAKQFIEHRVRRLTDSEMQALEVATDEALGRLDPI
jgi:mRNA interferase MazF